MSDNIFNISILCLQHGGMVPYGPHIPQHAWEASTWPVGTSWLTLATRQASGPALGGGRRVRPDLLQGSARDDQRRAGDSSSRGRARTGPAAARTLTPRESTREPNWFGAELARRPRSAPGQRPHRLDHAGPPARSPDINRFEVRISAPGDGWLERLGWRRWIPSRRPLPRPSSRRAMPAQGPAHGPGSPTIAKRPDRSPAVSRAKLHCKGLGGAGRRVRRQTAARNRPRRPPEGPWSPSPRESSESPTASSSTTRASRSRGARRHRA